jgi:REP element-mobilizing transposase RayT
MGRQLSAHERKRLAELCSERIESYLDKGSGACHLADQRVAGAMADALRHFDGVRYRLFAWCAMPNHVHVVFRPLPNHTLAEIVQTWKSYTAKQANRILHRTGAFWQREYYDHLARDEADFQRIVQYVIDNPASAGLSHWPWVWACGRDALGTPRE